MPTIALKYIEDDSQRTLSLTEGEVVPLGFDELAGLVGTLNQPISFPLRLTNVRIGINEFDDIDPSTVGSISATLNSTHGSNVIGLLKGGWLPSGLAFGDALILPDRCTVGAIRSRFVGGAVKSGKPDDFMDFAVGHSLKINPLLYAIEGSTGRAVPCESELSELFDRASQKIKEALPKAIIFPDKTAAMQGAIGLLRDAAHDFARKQHFLVEAAPLVAPSIGRATRVVVWRELFALAQHHGVKRASILMLTLLSATAAKQNMNPAKALLKPKKNYTDKDAYNALSDLRALDLLIAAAADFPNLRVVLLTLDRALSLLWTGLQTHSYRRDGMSIHYEINAHRGLFSGLTDGELSDMWAMLWS